MKGSLSVVVVFICLIVMLIFGGLFLGSIAAEVSGDDVSGTEFESVSSMVGSIYAAVQSAMPVIVWLFVIAALAFGLFAMVRFRKQ